MWKKDGACCQYITIEQVSESPVKNLGNLTGIPRKIRDNIADIFNQIQTWNNLHLCGIKIINSISVFKVQSSNNNNISSNQKFIDPELDKLTTSLSEIYKNLESVHSNLTIIIDKLCKLVILDEMEKNTNNPIFLTWPSSYYGNVFSTILDHYTKELKIKLFVTNSIGHSVDQNEIIIYSAYWEHQVNIPFYNNFLLEAALKETGFY